MLPQRYPKNGEEDIGLNRTAVSQTEGCILRRSHLAAYVIKPGLVLLTEHYICESKAYYNNLHVTKNNGQIYNAAYKCDLPFEKRPMRRLWLEGMQLRLETNN